jgi:hypothetical protein
MRALKLGALTLAFGGALLAAAPSFAQETNEQKLEEKLAKDFVSKAKWHTDYDEALKASKESGKQIFAYFTRSYAP